MFNALLHPKETLAKYIDAMTTRRILMYRRHQVEKGELVPRNHKGEEIPPKRHRELCEIHPLQGGSQPSIESVSNDVRGMR